MRGDVAVPANMPPPARQVGRGNAARAPRRSALAAPNPFAVSDDAMDMRGNFGMHSFPGLMNPSPWGGRAGGAVTGADWTTS